MYKIISQKFKNNNKHPMFCGNYVPTSLFHLIFSKPMHLSNCRKKIRETSHVTCTKTRLRFDLVHV